MNIEFKPISFPDLQDVKDIYDWYIKNTISTFHTEPILIEELQEFIFIDHPVYQSFLILVDHNICGFCFLTRYKKRQAYDRTAEVSVYVKKEFHKKGIGALALNHLETVAQKCGLKNLIGIICGENAGSINLFKKCGYVQCAHFKNVGEKFNKVLDVVAFQKEI